VFVGHANFKHFSEKYTFPIIGMRNKMFKIVSEIKSVTWKNFSWGNMMFLTKKTKWG
jgi:hypothetical protein